MDLEAHGDVLPRDGTLAHFLILLRVRRHGWGEGSQPAVGIAADKSTLRMESDEANAAS